MKHAIRVCMFAFTAVWSGCSDSSESAAEVPAPTPAQVESVPALPPPPSEAAGLDVLSRRVRRMSVDQLSRSIESFGNLEPGSIEIPEFLAFTLGKPDYLQTTEENLEPSPLFMKFMMDLGGIICPPLAASDEERPADERIFTRYSSLSDNLGHALLVATGIDGDDAVPYIARLTRVFEAGRVGALGDVSGYEAVCMALITSPEFLLY